MPSPRLFLSPPHMSGREVDEVALAFASNYVAPGGPALAAFEQAFKALTGFPHAVALTSGTAATHLALRHLDVGPGDEVWAASLTFIGSVGPAVHERATLVFFDSDETTWCLDPGLLDETLRSAARRNRLPKALIPTDIYGQSCDLDAIVSACAAYDVPVLCDSAEAMGAGYKGRHAGRGAWGAIYSFNGNKIITTSNGGMLASEDEALIEHARKLSQQAREAVPHYEHEEVGYNYRLSNILAAIGIGQLGALESRVARRRAIFARYRAQLSSLPGVSFMPEADYGRHNRWLTVMLVDPKGFGASPETLRLALEAHDIESRPVWKPMHLQPVFKDARYVGGGVAERLFAQGLCLPSGTAMSDDDVDRVCAVIAGVQRRESPARSSMSSNRAVADAEALRPMAAGLA
jgi:dTDP-4-amino-4,6-dideoxygalactose transaminase